MVNSKIEINKVTYEPRIIGFTCNWSAYSGAEMAGINQIQYPSNLHLVKLMCLGRLTPGLILKAFELGAGGVMLFSCPPEDCHYESGAPKAKEVFTQSKKLLSLLGINAKRFEIVEVPLGSGNLFAREVSRFVKRVVRLGPTGIEMRKVSDCQK